MKIVGKPLAGNVFIATETDRVVKNVAPLSPSLYSVAKVFPFVNRILSDDRIG